MLTIEQHFRYTFINDSLNRKSHPQNLSNIGFNGSLQQYLNQSNLQKKQLQPRNHRDMFVNSTDFSMMPHPIGPIFPPIYTLTLIHSTIAINVSSKLFPVIGYGDCILI